MLEHFPVGRRIAFDAACGRLWVVCPSCSQWSLSPLDERWEAVADAERLYRQTKLRVATDQIGLARLRDGTDLVRIGEPLRPEFAAWRYGARFRSRWRKQLGWGVAAGAAAAGYSVAGPLMGLISFGGLWIPWNAASIAHGAIHKRRIVANIPLPRGAIAMTDAHASATRVVPRPEVPVDGCSKSSTFRTTWRSADSGGRRNTPIRASKCTAIRHSGRPVRSCHGAIAPAVVAERSRKRCRCWRRRENRARHSSRRPDPSGGLATRTSAQRCGA